MKKIHHIAELIRIGNMPSLFTHCILGLAIATSNPKNSIDLSDIDLLLLIIKTLIGILLMYGGGNAMNDVIDIKKDHSTNRPLASGNLSWHEGVAISCILIISSLVIFYSTDALLWGIFLFTTLTAYNLLHQRYPKASSPFMGACRGLLIPLSAFSFGSFIQINLILLTSIPIAIWGTLITLIAIDEHKKETKTHCIYSFRWVLIWAFILCLIPIARYELDYDLKSEFTYLLYISPLILFLSFLQISESKNNLRNITQKRAVLGMIASFPLIDLALLGLIKFSILSCIPCLFSFLATRLNQYSKKGT